MTELKSIDLSELISSLEDTYKSTTITKFCLKSLCNEIYSLLNGWLFPDTFNREITSPICTCSNISQEETINNTVKVDSIIKEVDSVLNKARELRKSSSLNIKKSVNNKKINDHLKKNHVIKSNSQVQSLNKNGFKLTRPRSVLAKNKKPPPHLTTTYQQEFTQKIKKPLQKHKERNTSSRVVISKPSTSNITRKTITPSEITGIITKLASSLKLDEPLVATSHQTNSYPNFIDPNCAKHNIPIYKSNKYYTLQEAIDIIGVPSELLDILKLYHKHLSHILIERKMNKCQSSANLFLSKLEESNEKFNISYNESIIELFFILQMNIINLWDNPDINMQKQCAENLKHIDSKYKKWLNFDQTVLNNEVLKETTLIKQELSSEILPNKSIDWSFHGVWNSDSFESYIGLMQAPCIRYKNKDEWASFEMNMQEIQSYEFQFKIFHILNNILSKLSLITQKDQEFVKLLKLIFTLSHFPKLHTPILVESS